MEIAGVAEVKARLSEYLARVRGGEEVLVTDRGRPIARIVPMIQLVIVRHETPELVEGADLGPTERDDAGFGSTGRR